MGLIKAGMGALGGTFADQWKEFFYCESMPKEVLVTKGQKRVTGRSANTKGNDNIISNGSGIAVADGQCMIIVEQGKVVEVCAEPGEFTYDTSSEPSIFAGSLGESIKETFKTVGKRFTYGGERIREFITLILRRFWKTASERRIRFRSVLWIPRSDLISMYRSAVQVSILTRLPIRFCSTLMFAEMWSRNIPERNWMLLLRQSLSLLFSRHSDICQNWSFVRIRS